ncbi:TadE/TadG family type IV pilus assembly protein [Sphingosinicella terrae]|uniref:TadE/TadG family type IV pilus assembly protein n=1 Tax=Sphingosinicella terrae TaxID=2172047 RepID=UPI000E0D3C59|nr:TadE/TadG family type IV pilus assembly protein [Sphingosinicella terrae]
MRRRPVFRPSASVGLWADDRGAALTEFGLLLPVIAMLLLGAMDAGHTLYVRSVLEGEIQKAARDSGLESGTAEATRALIDGHVRDQLRKLGIEEAEVTVSRRFFRTFTEAEVAEGEPFTDSNGNGECDQGEPYEDHNGNSAHDADGGDAGQGGARDTVVYTVSVDYDRMFPMNGLIGLPSRVEMEGATVMNNQPYGEQGTYGPTVVRNCPAAP